MSKHISIIRYLSAIIITIAMGFHAAGIVPWNSILQLLGAAGWVYSAYKTRDKALMLNFASQFFVIIPTLIYIYF
jgi:hypothetical protein